MTTTIPKTQYAVQLTGPGQLRLNPSKEVPMPGPHQILARIECVGLCFSDLKLLKQFDQHARKSEVIGGLDASVLREIPSYVPGTKPTVPGHEVTCRIVAVGEKVTRHKVGERCLVQADFRDLPTANSNAAFGYNFEGALQEYVLVDERVMIGADGERFLIPAPEDLGASAVALVEPWACVEDSYVTLERQTVKKGGQLLIVAEQGHTVSGIASLVKDNMPAVIKAVIPTSEHRALDGIKVAVSFGNDLARLPDEAFDDILYFGASKKTLDLLNDKLASRGIMNVILGGKTIGAPVAVGVGRVHYGLTRWIGTTGFDPAESYRNIPRTGELRRGDRVLIVGAAGPMGQMHVIRTLCAGVEGVSVTGTDMEDARLESLRKKVQPLAEANGIDLKLVNSGKHPVEGQFSYIALMAPVGALVASAVKQSTPGAIINIFAGIPAPVKQEIDLDLYIANRCYMFGTSGSTIQDMKIVLGKVTQGQLDTNASVDAVSGMAGATDGIAAVENRSLAGKIIVYPMLHELGLTPLSELADRFPTVAARLDNGRWTRQAEQELLKVAK